MKKYNRYTPDNQQASLSLMAQGEHILLYAELEEKIAWIKEHLELSLDIFSQRIMNNMMIRSSKRYFINHLIRLYADRTR